MRILLFVVIALTLRADNFYLTVAGLGGEQEYEQRFTGWASDLTKLLQNEPNAKVDSLIGSAATKANIEAKLKALAGQAKATDNFTLLLIGQNPRAYGFAREAFSSRPDWPSREPSTA